MLNYQRQTSSHTYDNGSQDHRVSQRCSDSATGDFVTTVSSMHFLTNSRDFYRYTVDFVVGSDQRGSVTASYTYHPDHKKGMQVRYSDQLGKPLTKVDFTKASMSNSVRVGACSGYLNEHDVMRLLMDCKFALFVPEGGRSNTMNQRIRRSDSGLGSNA